MATNRRTVQRFITYLGITGLISVLVCVGFYQAKHESVRNYFFDLGYQVLGYSTIQIEELVSKNLLGHTSYLASSPYFQQFIDGDTTLRESILEHWLVYAGIETKQDLMEICWVDESGWQQMCIKRAKGELKVAGKNELLHDAEKPYFKTTARMTAGYRYISPVTLDKHNDELIVPFQPVQVIARPVYNSQYQNRGVLFVKVNSSPLLALASQASRHLWVADKDGYFLLGDSHVEWGSELGQPKHNMQVLFPDAWEWINQRSNLSRVEFDDGLWLSHVVRPIKGDPELFWNLIYHVPRADYAAQLAEYLKKVIIVACLICLALLPALWGLATRRRLVRTIISKEQRVAELLHETRLFQDMIDSLPYPFYMLNLETGQMLYVNDAAVTHFGAEREEILSWRIPEWDPVFTEERLAELLKNVKEHPTNNFETVHRLADGRKVPVEVNANSTYFQGQWISYGLFKDLSEIKKHEQSLIDAKEAAEAASNAKTTFLSFMSHELRTPLNAILGFSQLLECENEGFNEEQKQFLGEIIVSGHLLLSIINDILDLVKIGAGKLKIEQDDVSIDALIRDCVAMTRRMAENAKVKITVSEVVKEAPLVVADKLRLKQVLINLLHNAIKYNHEEGVVFIDVQVGSGDNLRINIVDTGIGISDAHQKNIFMSFDRLGMESSGIEGTGIGLIIAKTLTHLMNGQIGFSSIMGKGSHFWVQFPLAQGPLRRPGDQEHEEESSIAFFT